MFCPAETTDGCRSSGKNTSPDPIPEPPGAMREALPAVIRHDDLDGQVIMQEVKAKGMPEYKNLHNGNTKGR